MANLPDMIVMASTTADPLALPAFVIAIVAACTAVASLAWNVIGWRLSGPRVRVRTHLAFEGKRLRLAAYVWNKGRAPVDIVDAVAHHDGWRNSRLVPMLCVAEPEVDPGLPYRLEPGSSVVLQTEIWPEGPYYGRRWYRSVVTLANGAVVKSRRESAAHAVRH